jgi:ABC-2 type transport system ATP-binding protein
MVDISNLKLDFGNGFSIDFNDISIISKSVTGIVGNNGAGKTSFLRAIVDLIKVDNGNVFIDGISNKNDNYWKSIVGIFLDDSFLVEFFSAEEYFEFVGVLKGINKPNLYHLLSEFNEFFDGEILEKKKFIKDFSSGNKVKIGIAAAFIGSPRLIILDEPFAHLDPSSQIVLQKLITNKNTQHGITFIISSHNIEQVASTCNQILLFEKGKLIRNIKNNAEEIEKLRYYFLSKITK